MEELLAKYQALREAVELRFGRKIAVRSDFDLLCKEILDGQRSRISSTTLRRFWNYQNDQSSTGIRESSLDVLSLYAGYRSWRHFNSHLLQDEDSSHNSPAVRLYLEEMKPGTFIRMNWLPDRVVVVRYEGDYLFTILSSQNSKLQAGGTFRCQLMVDGELLSIVDLLYPGQSPVYYCCGKMGGVHYTVISPEED